MAEIFGGSLNDPRVSIRKSTSPKSSARTRSKFDAILLDVDNGPEGLTRKANDALYSSAGLNAAHAALRPRRRAGGLVVRAQSAVCKAPARAPVSTSTRSTCAPPEEAAARVTSSGSRQKSRSEHRVDIVSAGFSGIGWTDVPMLDDLAVSSQTVGWFSAVVLAKAGDPVRREPSVLSLTSLEYWNARYRLRQGSPGHELIGRRSFSEGGKPDDDD